MLCTEMACSGHYLKHRQTRAQKEGPATLRFTQMCTVGFIWPQLGGQPVMTMMKPVCVQR